MDEENYMICLFLTSSVRIEPNAIIQVNGKFLNHNFYDWGMAMHFVGYCRKWKQKLEDGLNPWVNKYYMKNENSKNNEYFFIGNIDEFNDEEKIKYVTNIGELSFPSLCCGTIWRHVKKINF